jgi:hypothetical protein
VPVVQGAGATPSPEDVEICESDDSAESREVVVPTSWREITLTIPERGLRAQAYIAAPFEVGEEGPDPTARDSLDLASR